MKLGKFELYIAWDGYFKLDGGAMFGVVPKPLWDKKDPADDRNRILLSLNPLIIRFDNEIILVDTGIGDKWDKKISDILSLKRSDNLLNSLSKLGIGKNDITGVLLTHLHFDHSGGAVELNDRGELIPAFPNAVYFIQQGEWDFATNPNERTKTSYIQDNFLPLNKHGKVNFLKGNQEIFPGITVEITGGHTPFHQMVLIESERNKACYCGDIFPTASHLKVPYIMGYDTNPLDTLEYKKKCIKRAIDEVWLVIFPHSPHMRAGYLRKTESEVVLEQVEVNNAK